MTDDSTLIYQELSHRELSADDIRDTCREFGFKPNGEIKKVLIIKQADGKELLPLCRIKDISKGTGGKEYKGKHYNQLLQGYMRYLGRTTKAAKCQQFVPKEAVFKIFEDNFCNIPVERVREFVTKLYGLDTGLPTQTKQVKQSNRKVSTVPKKPATKRQRESILLEGMEPTRAQLMRDIAVLPLEYVNFVNSSVDGLKKMKKE
jgi:hypothetical protein